MPSPSWTRGLAAEARPTLALAGPLILSNLAATTLGTIDVVLIGRLGPEALAAAALGTNLYMAAFLAGIGIVTAVAPLASAEFGRTGGPGPGFAPIVGQGLWVALAYCTLMLPVLWHGEAILLAIGQAPALARAAGHYLRWLEWAMAPQLAFVVLRSFVSSLGRPGWPLIIALAGLPMNGGLAWLLVFGGLGVPALGLAGAGIATTAAASLACLALVLVVWRERGFAPYRALASLARPNGRVFLALLRLGVPIGLTLTFETALFSGSGLAMGLFGATPLAAHAIALQTASLCFMVPLGLSQAATIRVGQARGAGDRAAAARAGWTALALALAFMAATAALLVAAPGAIVALYLDGAAPGAAEVARLAIVFLGFAALFQLADGLQVVAAGTLRGLADTRVPMLYAALGYWGIGAPLGLILAFRTGWAEQGLWIGLSAGLGIVAALMVQRWSSLSRRPPDTVSRARASGAPDGVDTGLEPCQTP